ncbi:unnamed protein product [Gordionus sp. m RMFG-2023]|uniref:symplekin-like isoform X1 n=1 Tax=Gordionus sp. m RMFG-2023 TaxID=3053472 RepID=UPI0030E2B926
MNTAEKVISLLNVATLSTYDLERISALKEAQELLLTKEPELLDKFINDILAFQADKSIEIKKTIINFIEEACKRNPHNLSKVLGHLNILLRDCNPIIQKKIIQIITTIYKLFLEWVTKSVNVQLITDMTHQIWIFLKGIKSYVLNLLESENDGIRTQVIKFMEMIVLSQSCRSADSFMTKTATFSLDEVPERHKFLRYLQLQEESKQIFNTMINLCGSITISHSNLNTLLGSLTDIALQRPQYMNKVVSSFINLYNKLPPTLAKSQVSSVKKGIKNRLMSLIKHPSSIEFQQPMIAILIELGASHNDILKNLPKISKVNSQMHLGDDITRKFSLEENQPINFKSLDITDEKLEENIKNQIYESLDKQTVIDLVLDHMNYLPEIIPKIFVDNYQPIRTAGSNSQIMVLAQLLTDMISKDNKPIFEKVEAETFKDYGRNFQKSTSNINKHEIMEGKEESKKLDDGSHLVMAFQALSSRLKKCCSGARYDLVSRATKSRQLLRSLPAHDHLALLIPDFEVNTLCINACLRILTTASPSACQQRIPLLLKIIQDTEDTSPKLFSVVVDYILENMLGQYELALSLLMKTYENALISLNNEFKQYEDLLNLFIRSIMEKNIWINELLLKLLLEVPLITESNIQQLKQCIIGSDNDAIIFSIFIKMSHYRPSIREVIINQLILDFTIHSDNLVIRRLSLDIVVEIYNNKNYSSIIEEFALRHLKLLSLESPPKSLYSKINYQNNFEDKLWNDETIKLCLQLFLQILPKNHKFINDLINVYVDAHSDIKRIILRSLEGPVKLMGGVESSELLSAIKKCVKGSETLITRLVYILTIESSSNISSHRPPVSLVNAVRWLYYQTKTVTDVRLLIPIVTGLTREEILNLLPKFVALSNINLLKEVLYKCCSYVSILTPSELLVALHMIPAMMTPSFTTTIPKVDEDTGDPEGKVEIEENTCDTKALIRAINICFANKRLFTPEVISIAIESLVEVNPLPILFMRSVIQSIVQYPKLIGFIVKILYNLVEKEIWKQKQAWLGFIKCCQKIMPQSLPILILLPIKELKDLFMLAPDLKETLLDYINKMSPEKKTDKVKEIINDILKTEHVCDIAVDSIPIGEENITENVDFNDI